MDTPFPVVRLPSHNNHHTNLHTLITNSSQARIKQWQTTTPTRKKPSGISSSRALTTVEEQARESITRLHLPLSLMGSHLIPHNLGDGMDNGDLGVVRMVGDGAMAIVVTNMDPTTVRRSSELMTTPPIP